MGMKEMMLWPIDRPSFIDGQNMNCDSKFGMPMGIPFLVHPIHILSFLSHMTSPFSSKMTKGQLVIVIKTAAHLPNQKVMGNL